MHFGAILVLNVLEAILVSCLLEAILVREAGGHARRSFTHTYMGSLLTAIQIYEKFKKFDRDRVYKITQALNRHLILNGPP